jgi:glutathione S-transferase
MLKIWGRVNSINVQKPLMVLEEIGLPYERIDAGLNFGINDTDAYKAMNPNGVVPTIDDDGFILWESNSIARYLARKHGKGKLWPDDVQAQANQDRWMDWQLATMITPVNAMFVPLIRAKDNSNPEAVEAARQRSGQVMAMLDGFLADNEFISGSIFGVADCVLGPSIHRWYNLPIERPKLASLERWFDALMQRPSAQKIIISPIT